MCPLWLQAVFENAARRSLALGADRSVLPWRAHRATGGGARAQSYGRRGTRGATGGAAEAVRSVAGQGRRGGRERGLLTREDLLLCTSSCKSWRFGLLAMLPPGTPSYEGLVRTRLDLSLKDLAWALRTGRREAQTMVTDFLRAHPGAVDPINLYILIRYFFPYSEKNIHHDAKNDDDYSENDDDYSDLRTLSEAALEELLENDDDYSDLRTLSEAALDELLKHQPENVPVELEQFLFKLVIDQAERRSDIGEARERARVRERRRRREREREREREACEPAAASSAWRRSGFGVHGGFIKNFP